MTIALMTGRPGSGKSYEAVAYAIMPALAAGRRVVTNIPLDIQTIGVILAKQITASGWALPDALECSDAGGRLAADAYLNADGREADATLLESVETAIADIAEPAKLRASAWDEPTADVLYFPSDVWRTPAKPGKGDDARGWQAAQHVRAAWFKLALETPGALFVLDEVWRLWPSGQLQATVPVEERSFLAEHRHAVADGRAQEIVLLVQSRRNMASWPMAQVDHWVQLNKLNKLGISNGYKTRIWDSVELDATLLRKEVRRYDPRYWRCYQSATRAMYTDRPTVTTDGITYEVERWQIGHPFSRHAGGVGDESTTDARASVFGGGRGVRLALIAAGFLAAVAGVFVWWFSMGAMAGAPAVAGDDDGAAAVQPGAPVAGHGAAALVRNEGAQAVHVVDQPLPAAAPAAAAGLAREAFARAALASTAQRTALAELVAGFDGRAALEPAWLAGASVVPDRIALCAGRNCGRVDLAQVRHVRVAECVATVAGRVVLCGSAEEGGGDDDEDSEAGVDLGEIAI